MQPQPNAVVLPDCFFKPRLTVSIIAVNNGWCVWCLQNTRQQCPCPKELANLDSGETIGKREGKELGGKLEEYAFISVTHTSAWLQ